MLKHKRVVDGLSHDGHVCSKERETSEFAYLRGRGLETSGLGYCLPRI